MENTSEPRVLLAVTGASGAIYARVLLARLLEREATVGLTISRYGLQVIQEELGPGQSPVGALLGHEDARVTHYPVDDFHGPFATGSRPWQAVAIVPCSMGTVGRIAAGVSTDLITRAADVALKERRRLLLAPREMPLNVIHLRNLTALAEAGAVIAPPMPAFYQKPASIEELVDGVCTRLLASLMV